MREENQRITNYLRKAVLAQVDKAIDFKNEEFYKISKESFVTGNIDVEITSKFFENNKKELQKGEGKNTENVSCPNQMLAATLFCGVQMHR